VAVGKITAYLCLTLIIVKELKISVEQGRVVTTLNNIFCVVYCSAKLLAHVNCYPGCRSWTPLALVIPLAKTLMKLVVKDNQRLCKLTGTSCQGSCGMDKPL
jgi:hypothetical protein